MGTVGDEGDRLTDIGPEAIDIAQNTHRMAVALEALVEKINISTAVNNSVTADLVEKVNGPNPAGWAMLLGVTHGFAISLAEILDSDLDMFKRSQKLRELQKRSEAMMAEYEKKLDEIRKEAKGDNS